MGRSGAGQLSLVLGALGRAEGDAAVGRLAGAFGGGPDAVGERLVGEPAVRSRRLSFAAGGEIILHDDVVVAVLLHLVPTARTAWGIDLTDWIPGGSNEATLTELAEALGGRRRFAGAEPYVELDGGYVRPRFADGRGWNDPGRLLSLAVIAGQPGLSCRPEDDDCSSCADLLVRAGGEVDVDATTAVLQAAVSAERLVEDAGWVGLADLRPIHASRLMARVESQLQCTRCRRIVCFTLVRDSSPVFQHHVLNDARRHRLEAIPPVEQWGDADRIAADRAAMHYVEHEPGSWFLLEQHDELFLDARYSHSALIDDSALIRLDPAELATYRSGGRQALSELARRIHQSAPYQPDSPYFHRDLYRGPDARSRRDSVSTALINHSWLAQRRQRGGATH